jgi:hypothetical protein
VTRRSLAYASVTVLLLIGALVLGLTLRERGGPAASPGPAASIPAASASPTAAAVPVLDDRFGFTVYGGGRGVVRSEASDAAISAFPLNMPSFSTPAISPDGRSVAYWDPGTGGPALHVRSIAGGAARTALTGNNTQIAGRVVWSVDGTGLAAVLQGEAQEIGSGNRISELWTIDVASGATELIASGSIRVPIAWDRTAKLIAAGVTGPGGYAVAYELISLAQKPYAVRSTPLAFASSLIGGLKATRDARYVLLTTFGGTSASWWPLANPDARSTIELDARDAEWRPGTSQIWWISGLTPAGCQASACTGTQLVSFDVATGARTVARQGTFDGTLAGFRVDGSAAITVSYGRNAIELTFVDLATGHTAKVTASGTWGAPVRLR